ncbi:unnamed protein product [Caretta caretta]
MKDFMIALVKKSDVGPDRVQFRAVKYSDEPETFFYLNKYTAKSEIVEAIQNDVTKGGSTYTAKAIDYSEALFAQEHGSRKSKGSSTDSYSDNRRKPPYREKGKFLKVYPYLMLQLRIFIA